NEAGQNDAYYTGQLHLPAQGSAEVLQFFAESCPSGQYYAAANAAQCDTRVPGLNGDAVTTTTSLAGLVVAVPGQIWFSASLATGGVEIISGTAATLSNANPAPASSWNPETHHQLVPF